MTDWEIKAYITNLGKYNEGYLIGEWVKFPTTFEELQKVFQRIGINERYEEWFITDYECEIGTLYDMLDMYENLDELNYLASKIEELDSSDRECFEAALEHGEYSNSIKDVINLMENLDCYTLYSDVHNDYDLGYYWVEESGAYNKEALGNLGNYIDYESLGRDTRFSENGIFTEQGYCISYTNGFKELYSGRDDIPDEYKVMSCPESEIETVVAHRIKSMTADEKDCHIGFVEIQQDYSMTGSITKLDYALYEALIKERAAEKKPSIKKQLAELKGNVKSAVQTGIETIKNKNLGGETI